MFRSSLSRPTSVCFFNRSQPLPADMHQHVTAMLDYLCCCRSDDANPATTFRVQSPRPPNVQRSEERVTLPSAKAFSTTGTATKSEEARSEAEAGLAIRSHAREVKTTVQPCAKPRMMARIPSSDDSSPEEHSIDTNDLTCVVRNGSILLSLDKQH